MHRGSRSHAVKRAQGTNLNLDHSLPPGSCIDLKRGRALIQVSGSIHCPSGHGDALQKHPLLTRKSAALFWLFVDDIGMKADHLTRIEHTTARRLFGAVSSGAMP
jgi:hypothetical protein